MMFALSSPGLRQWGENSGQVQAKPHIIDEAELIGTYENK